MKILAALAFTVSLCAADLERVRLENNPEKRSQAAMENASKALREARDAYGKGEFDRSKTLLDEVAASVTLAEDSLKQTRKDPRRSPKWFKKAELASNELLRKLESFRQEMSVTDREAVERVKEVVQNVHQHWLEGIMGIRK